MNATGKNEAILTGHSLPPLSFSEFFTSLPSLFFSSFRFGPMDRGDSFVSSFFKNNMEWDIYLYEYTWVLKSLLFFFLKKKK